MTPNKELARLSLFGPQCHDGGYVNLTSCDTILSFLINFVPLFVTHRLNEKKRKDKTKNNRKHSGVYYVEVEHRLLSVILHACETRPIALREEHRSRLLSYYVTYFLVSEEVKV